MDRINSTKVFKKTSANSVLTLYLGSRDLISRNGVIEPLKGIIFMDPKFMCSQKIYGQLTLTFRYGREDEEVMGLKFCNEAVIAIKQIWPRVNYDESDITPLQQALLDRLGTGAHPFSLKICMAAPPSIQLVPAKKYNGSPIGTSYDIRIFMSDQTDEKLLRRTTIKLGIRLLHKILPDSRVIQQTTTEYTSLPKSIRSRLSSKQLKFHYHSKSHSECKNSIDLHSEDKIAEIVGKPESLEDLISDPASVETHPLRLLGHSSSLESKDNYKVTKPIDIATNTSSVANLDKGPEFFVDKPFLWTEGRVSLKASLNKSTYKHNENMIIYVNIQNNSRKIIRKIRIFAVQHVDVCMFSNGKFKNVVADLNETHQIKPNECYNQTYNLTPTKGPTKNWIAVEGSFSQYYGIIGGDDDLKNDSIKNKNFPYKLASSAHRIPSTGEDRNVFAIYVSYYVKIKLTLSGMGGEVSLKLPFILGYIDNGDKINNDIDNEIDIDIQNKNLDDEISTLTLDENIVLNDSTKKTASNNKNVENIIEEELSEDYTKTTTTTTAIMHFHKDAEDEGNENGKVLNLEENKNEKDNEKNINAEDRMKNEKEKFIKDKSLLQKYKLKRSSYSRSAEDIEHFFKINEIKNYKDNDDEDDDGSDDFNVYRINHSRTLCHRHSIDTNHIWKVQKAINSLHA